MDMDVKPRRVVLLGSTGSIGQSALDVISRLPDELSVLALAGHRNVARLAEQTLRHQPSLVCLSDPTGAAELRDRIGNGWQGRLLVGPDALPELAAHPDADVVLNGLVGAAGLTSSWAALCAGKALALANKESLVIAGELLTDRARESGVPILPVDSEHNALFQLMVGERFEDVRAIRLTASGGPFRTRDLGTFDTITPAEALKHPTWSMGRRITVDSASLLNKGFEVIEAKWLFDLDPAQIKVWVHPESIIHGFIEWKDGSTTAQLAEPDMRVPIQYALCYPKRTDSPVPHCDLARIGALHFEDPDSRRYPCLDLAMECMRIGGTAPAVLNAADEVVVEAFLEGALRFTQIAPSLERILEVRPNEKATDVEGYLRADAWAREEARRTISQLT